MKIRSLPFLLTGLCLILAACRVIPEPTETTEKNEPTLMPTTVPAVASTQPVEPTAQALPTATQPTTVQETSSYFELAHQSSQPNFSRIIWSQDGTLIGLVSAENVSVLDSQTLSLLYSYSDPDVLILDLSSDGHTLLSTIDQQTLLLTDLRTGDSRSIDTGSMIVSASFSPEGSLILVGTTDNWKAKIYDTTSGELRKELSGFESAAPVYSVRFAENVLDILWISRGEVQIQNIASGELKPAFSHEDFVNFVTRAHTLPLLVTASSAAVDNEFVPILDVWNPDSGEKILEIKLNQAAYSGSFSKDDNLLAVGTADGVHIFKTSDMSELSLLSDHTNGVVDTRFSPSDDHLATLDGNGELRIWQLVTQP